MATSKIYGIVTYSDGQSHNWFNAKLVITDTRVQNSNSSIISWAYYVWMSSASLTPYKYKYGNKLTVSIGGRQLVNADNYGTHDPTDCISEDTALKYASGSITVAHNADGTLTLPVYLKYEQTQTSTLDSVVCSGSHACTAIPLTTAITAPDGTLGTEQSLSLTKQNTAYTVTVAYAFTDTSYSGTIAEKTSDSIIKWTPPIALASDYTDRASFECVYTVTTYSGNATVGTVTAKAVYSLADEDTIVIPEGSVSFSAYQTYPALSGITDIIAGKTKLKASLTSAIQGDKYGATVTDVKYTIDGTEYSVGPLPCEFYVDNPLASSNRYVTISLTNSRGRQLYVTHVWSVYTYLNPYISGLTADRCDQDGNAGSGNYIKIDGVPGGSSFGTNSFSVSYLIDRDGSGSGTYTPITLPAIIGDGTVQSNYTYTVHIKVTDLLDGKNSYTRPISDESVPFNIKPNGKAVGIGAYATEDDSFNIGYTKVLHKGVEVNLDSGDSTELNLDDKAGNTLNLLADGTMVIDTDNRDMTPSTTPNLLGYKLIPSCYTTAAGSSRGATLQIRRRLNGVDESLIGYLLTTGLIEIRTGTSEALDTSAAGVQTTFSKAMSSTPDIILLQPLSGKAGVAAPKIVSKSATGFYATLGGSTGTGTQCLYLAIKFHYFPDSVG